MKHFLFAILSFFLLQNTSIAQISIDLVPLVSGFNQPVDIANAGDDRLFVVEKDGYIRVIENGVVLDEPFLDIDDQVRSSAEEQGLLGLAFHPDYANNGYFYVNYTNNAGNTFISRYKVSQSNPNIADPNSGFILFTTYQPHNNHNGGDLNFGPDGYLYIGLGDGGGGGDPGNRAQNMNLPHGKILRIDVDNGTTYDIPDDNPFAGPGVEGMGEIWASGLRNPWRFSFDSETGDMWIADVGQDTEEEINFQPAASAGGENYGWRCFEGSQVFNDFDCGDRDEYIEPVHTYVNNSTTSGCSVTGGYVYRGDEFLRFTGVYIYADYCTGNFWYLQRADEGQWVNKSLGQFYSYNYSSFGEDNKGELYVAGLSDGVIYTVTDPTSLPIDLLSFTANLVDNNEVMVKWITATETNSDYFDVQRSIDGSAFVTIGKVAAAGMSSKELTYDFLDEQPIYGTSYYRLRQADIDGTVTYSDIVQVKTERGYITPNIYPNPIQSEQSLTVDFGNIPNTAININISDMSGKQVYSQQFGAGQNVFNIPLSGFASGIYVITGRFDEYHFYKKLIVH